MKPGLRGQSFSIDFITSIFIVLLLLTQLSTIRSSIDSVIVSKGTLSHAIEAAGDTADVLVSSQGSPSNWDTVGALNASSVGLRGVAGLSMAKILSLMDACESDYYALKTKIGLPGVEFQLSLVKNLSDNQPILSGVAREPIAYLAGDQRSAFGQLDPSNATWDYYWAVGSAPEPDYGSSRAQYSGVGAALLDQLLLNSSYASIVIEAPNITASSVNTTRLQSYLANGGTIVYLGGIEDSVAIGSLATFARNDTLSPGRVVSPGWILRNVASGSTVSAGSVWRLVNSSVATVSVSSSANSSEALVAYWQYGAGQAYFIGNFSATYGQSGGDRALNVVGWPIQCGVAPSNQSIAIYPVTRLTFIESDRRTPVAMRLLMWTPWG